MCKDAKDSRDRKWTRHHREAELIPQLTLTVAQEHVRQQVAVADFEDHLDDVAQDFLNPHVI